MIRQEDNTEKHFDDDHKDQMYSDGQKSQQMNCIMTKQIENSMSMMSWKGYYSNVSDNHKLISSYRGI